MAKIPPSSGQHISPKHIPERQPGKSQLTGINLQDVLKNLEALAQSNEPLPDSQLATLRKLNHVLLDIDQAALSNEQAQVLENVLTVVNSILTRPASQQDQDLYTQLNEQLATWSEVLKDNQNAVGLSQDTMMLLSEKEKFESLLSELTAVEQTSVMVSELHGDTVDTVNQILTIISELLKPQAQMFSELLTELKGTITEQQTVDTVAPPKKPHIRDFDFERNMPRQLKTRPDAFLNPTFSSPIDRKQVVKHGTNFEVLEKSAKDIRDWAELDFKATPSSSNDKAVEHRSSILTTIYDTLLNLEPDKLTYTPPAKNLPKGLKETQGSEIEKAQNAQKQIAELAKYLDQNKDQFYTGQHKDETLSSLY